MEIKAKKSLGQNFLTDNNILEKIANSTDATKDDLIIEIGPGKGALTKKLQDITNNILAFEIDERMHEFLDLIEKGNTKIIYEDILKANLEEYISSYQYNKIYVIANIPYYITTPIIKKLIDSNIEFSNIVLLVQKEFAERLTAEPGQKQYGSLTVYLNCFFKIEKLFQVKAGCFNPAPKVDSAVIKLISDKKTIENESQLYQLIEDSFRFKRKTLKKNLYNYDWEKISLLLRNNGYKETTRAEELPLEMFIALAKIL